MKTVKVNFTIPEDVVAVLNALVSERSRSAFVGAAIRDKLTQLEQEALSRNLTKGYLARREEDAEVSREWEEATLERC